MIKGIGAIVFLLAFFATLFATLAVPSLPIGIQLYNLLGVPVSTYPVLGIGVTVLASAVFNGVFYGVIAWLIFTFGVKRFLPV